MLVVIAIIGLLAALVMGILPRANDMKIRTRVKAELAQLETVIEHYKEKRGYFPPDNASDPGANPLYYELVGATYDKSKNEYTTLTGDGPVPAAAITAAFGVGGIVNANSAGGAEDAKNFFTAIKANQISTNGPVKFLGISTQGPNHSSFCPWFYNSSNPIHNANGFDLWVDVMLNGKTNTFGNWKKD